MGGSQTGSTIPDDHVCWQRPEDMDYRRPVQTTTSAPELAAEMAAAMAAASIVFQDDAAYSKRLTRGAETLFHFARGSNFSYSRDNPFVEPYYNSTGYYDEHVWGATWLFLSTGNFSYLSLGWPIDHMSWTTSPNCEYLAGTTNCPLPPSCSRGFEFS